MIESRTRRGGLVLAIAMVAAACSGGASSADRADAPSADEPAPATSLGTGPDTTASAPTSVGAVSVSCPTDAETVAWAGDVQAQAQTVQEQTADTPGVALVMYPRPDYKGKPWSHWGQGIVLSDGRFLSAIGDHHGADGNSFIYEYDPATMTLTQIVDVLATVPHQPGDWGFGKVHAQMVGGPCGEVFVSTYWGTRRNLTFTEGYQGDILLRLDPVNRTTENLGVILPEHGVASMAATPDGSLLYGEAADPFGQKEGSFVVLDAATGDVVFEDDSPAHGGYRSIAVGPDGSAYITWNDTGLARYDPATNTLSATSIEMPGSILRAATQPDANGRIYAVSRQPATFFAFDPDGTVTELGPANGYTTSLALAPDGDRFYYIPDAHGGAWNHGTTLFAVDTTTGEAEAVVQLNPLVEEHHGLRAGGTYSVAVSADGKTIYVELNAGDPATRDTFGEVLLAVVTLP